VTTMINPNQAAVKVDTARVRMENMDRNMV